MADKPDWNVIRAEELDRTVGTMFEEVIAESHGDIGEYEIAVLFKPKTWSKGGKEIAGKAALCGGQEKLLSDVDGVVTLAWDWWDAVATREQKVALLDHELSHFVVEFDDDTGEATLTIVGHDVEEFLGVWERHGAWTEDLVKAEAQLRLNFGDDEEDLAVTISTESGTLNTTVAGMERAAEMVGQPRQTTTVTIPKQAMPHIKAASERLKAAQ